MGAKLWYTNTYGDNNHDMNLGEFIREARLRRGITQQELATRAGLSREVVSSLERGRKSLAPLTQAKIENALGLKYDASLDGTGIERALNLRVHSYAQIEDLRRDATSDEPEESAVNQRVIVPEEHWTKTNAEEFHEIMDIIMELGAGVLPALRALQQVARQERERGRTHGTAAGRPSWSARTHTSHTTKSAS